MRSFLFVLRFAVSWGLLLLFASIMLERVVRRLPDWIVAFAVIGTLMVVLVRAYSHVKRVRLITDRLDASTLGSRHRRQIEMPMPAGEAFDVVEAAIRELPHLAGIEAARDSLQIRARLKRMDPYMGGKSGSRDASGGAGARRNLVLATVTPREATGSLTLICEPERGAWVDWFMVDDGTNLENAEAITRAITRRVADRRKDEQALARQTATEKELTVAKLSLLHAQVEPHFLYNTLASAQVLTRSDPARADQMLGNLITYLRRSLPSAEESMSTLGDEVERAQAYLDILRIRMGERLKVEVQVPDALKGITMPPMMLQTLVENAIKHGLEPMPGGGTVWIIARENEGKAAITVADDGRGFSESGGGTAVGLKNVRERLRLAYGDAAHFSLVANFPRGVAATITVPAGPRRDSPSALAVSRDEGRP